MQENRKDLQIEIPDEIRKLLDQSDPKLKEFVYFLAKEINSLKARLRIYENPHVPSSKQIVKEEKPVKEQKQIGAPRGHRGAKRRQ